MNPNNIVKIYVKKSVLLSGKNITNKPENDVNNKTKFGEHRKTKKNQSVMSKNEKAKLWDTFDSDKKEIHCIWSNPKIASFAERLSDATQNSDSLSSATFGKRPSEHLRCYEGLNPCGSPVEGLKGPPTRIPKDGIAVQGGDPFRGLGPKGNSSTDEYSSDITTTILNDGNISVPEMPPIKEKSHEMDKCHLCSSTLIITEDGFPTCTNKTCSRINTNTLDYSPEWRFYGADDKNQTDPTRCGNPINPLLVESSFGCKVLVSNSSTYEMRKIRKWTEWQSMPHKEKSLYDEFQFITVMAQGVILIFIILMEGLVLRNPHAKWKKSVSLK
jgi:hypothetical protein